MEQQHEPRRGEPVLLGALIAFVLDGVAEAYRQRLQDERREPRELERAEAAE